MKNHWGYNMSENNNKQLCEERHKRVDERLLTHETRLNGHSNRLDVLEQYKSKSEEKIDNLCDKIDKLIHNNNKWFYAVTTGMAGLLIKFLFFSK